MPLPRDDTTPPVTKMYFVELTDSPPSVGASAVLPHIADRRRCRRPGPRAPETAPRRWESRAAGAAAARGAPTAPPGQEIGRGSRRENMRREVSGVRHP